MIYVKVNRNRAFKEPGCQLKSLILLLGFSSALAVSGTSPSHGEPFQHRFGELREYHKHWLAVCPNKHDPQSKSSYQTTCWASTYLGKSGDYLLGTLSVSRNRVTGAHGITFVTDAYTRLDRTAPVSLRFSDGAKMQFSFGTQIVNTRSINQFAIADSEVEKMLSAMKRTNGMTLILPTDSGKEKFRYSMIGLRAALKFTSKYARPRS